jgi:hypothetical protein
MNIYRCLVKICPGWCGSVWDNKYEGIKPHELETRPIPTLKELEAVWPQVQAEMEAEKINAEVKAKLIEIDLKSIRSLREWVAKQPDAPQYLKDYEAQASEARAKLGKM